MILNSPYISGSLTVTGNITAQGGIAISGSIASSSFATTASNALALQGLGSASFAPASTFNTVSQSFASESGSMSSRVTTIESKYATTGSNTFTNLQYISATTNAASFTTSASLYTDGGLRVSKDSFISGTAYFNNVVVYGTSSIQYITSSQVNVGSNIINLNTQTPAVRFGGIAVADSGSNAGITGSLLWDSIYNRWIYSNPSGSTYDGGMIISGPRNTSGLGNELGTTACALMMGQGGDHITSSAVFSYGNATCFYGTSFVSSSGAACFAGQICSNTLSVAGNVNSNTATFNGIAINNTPTSVGTSANFIRLTNTGNDFYVGQESSVNAGFFAGACAYDNVLYGGKPLNVIIGGVSRMYLNVSGSLGIGTGTPVRKLDIISTSEQLRLAYDTSGTVYSDFRNDSAGGLLVNTSGPYIINYISGSARMRIDASAVCFTCQVCTNGITIASGNQLRFYRADNAIYTTLYDAGSLAANGFILNNTNGEGFHFQNSGTTIMRMNSAGSVGIGTCSPCVALDVNCNFGSIISATTRTNDACCSEVRAGWVGGSWMRMGYHPTSAVGYIDNTYNIVSGQAFGDVQFRQNAGGTMVTRLLLKADGGLILSCGRTSSIMANVGNIQEWVGQVGTVNNNTGWSLFSINNIYDNLSMDIYVFTDVGSYQTSKHDVVMSYTQFTNNAIGFASAFCIFKTGTLYNETMTICNLSGSNVNQQKIAIRVWGYGVNQNGTGGTNLLNTSCLTRIK